MDSPDSTRDLFDWATLMVAMLGVLVTAAATAAAITAGLYAKGAWEQSKRQADAAELTLKKTDDQLEIAKRKDRDDQVQHQAFLDSLERNRRSLSPYFRIGRSDDTTYYEHLGTSITRAKLWGAVSDAQFWSGWDEGHTKWFRLKNLNTEHDPSSVQVAIEEYPNHRISLIRVPRYSLLGGSSYVSESAEDWLLEIQGPPPASNFTISIGFETANGFADVHRYRFVANYAGSAFLLGLSVSLDRIDPVGLTTIWEPLRRKWILNIIDEAADDIGQSGDDIH